MRPVISPDTDNLVLHEVGDGDQDDGHQHQDEGEPGVDPGKRGVWLSGSVRG